MGVPNQTATSPATTQVLVERPQHGLAQGQYAWPEWAVLGLGALGVVFGLAYLVLRLRRLRARS